MIEVHQYTPPTPEQLLDLVMIGREMSEPQDAFGKQLRHSNANFFLPREIDGYVTGETPYDDFYWTTRFTGRVATKGRDIISLRIRESTTVCEELLGFTERERIAYIFEWSPDMLHRAMKYDIYATASDANHSAVRDEKNSRLLMDISFDDEIRAVSKEVVSSEECARLSDRMSEFGKTSLTLYYRSLATRGNTGGRAGIATANEHLLNLIAEN
jgi:hypothetical protein